MTKEGEGINSFPENEKNQFLSPEVKAMVRIDKEVMKKPSRKGKKKSRKKEKPLPYETRLPYCTLAASAEHARGFNEDDPCEDFRSGYMEGD